MSEKPTSPEGFMQRAIELAGRGFPAPNPRVGCVLVRDRQVIGEGWHEAYGLAHAERMALDSARDAVGATAYVTLEPCNHFGLQPPCSDGLIQAGVAEVIYAVSDPNPKAFGGDEKLRAAGIGVSQGLCAEEAETANVAWLTAMRRRRPYVTVKVAMSLEGRIALPSGESQWITGPEARAEGRRLRAEMGCVVVGAGTIQKDNPQLTARIEGLVKEPKRVAWDPFGKLSSVAEGIHLSRSANETALLEELWASGQTSVLVEGGAWTISQFLAAGLVDRIELFIAPKVLGEGLTWANLSVDSPLDRNPDWRIEKSQTRGNDVQLSLVSESSRYNPECES